VKALERALIVVAALFIALTIPHVIEDVTFGETARLGLTMLQAGLVVGGLHALLVLAVFDASRRGRLGAWAMIVIGLIWTIGIIVIHGPEIQTGGFGRGGASLVLLAAMFVLALALTALGGRILLRLLDKD